jgi:hypothetical protein
MTCPHCGAHSDPESRFCSQCRKRIAPPSPGFDVESTRRAATAPRRDVGAPAPAPAPVAAPQAAARSNRLARAVRRPWAWIHSHQRLSALGVAVLALTALVAVEVSRDAFDRRFFRWRTWASRGWERDLELSTKLAGRGLEMTIEPWDGAHIGVRAVMLIENSSPVFAYSGITIQETFEDPNGRKRTFRFVAVPQGPHVNPQDSNSWVYPESSRYVIRDLPDDGDKEYIRDLVDRRIVSVLYVRNMNNDPFP